MNETTISKMMAAIDTCAETMKEIEDKNMILAMTFTILDMAAGFVGVPTTEILKEHMPIIEEVNSTLGTMAV